MTIATNWWSLVIRGLVAIVFGLATFMWPGITVGALILLFGAYALVDGVVSLVGVFRASRAHERWGALLFEGLAGIAASAVTILMPGITAIALVYVIGAWALVTGVFEIAAAVRLRKKIAGEWLLGLAGVASILFGIMLVIFPLAGAVVIALWVGIYAIVFGVILIGLGVRLRNWKGTSPSGSPITAPAV
jgi:uncharacterized membrane protein HdeD (DUF308 family)